MELKFTVYGKPKPAGSKRAFPFKKRDGSTGVRVTDDCETTKNWQNQVASAALEAMEQLPAAYRELFWESPLEMHCHFYLKRPQNHFRSGKFKDQLKPDSPGFHTTKPDATKLMRAVEDAMTTLVYKDDAAIVRPHPHKHYGTPERCEIRIHALAAQ